MTHPSRTPRPGFSVTPPGQGELLRAGPVIHRVLEDGAAVDGRFAVLECQMPAAWPGPPQHIHHEHDEAFLVLTGNVEFVSGTAVTRGGPGTLVTVPAGVPHTFGNGDADHPATLICTVTPGRYVHYFRDLQHLGAGRDGLLDPKDILELMARYATEPYSPDREAGTSTT